MNFESIDVETHRFDVVRKGYDPDQVTEFLGTVTRAMARLEERGKIAEVRADQLERELRDMRTRTDATIQETVSARAHLLELSQQPSATPPSHAEATSPNMASLEAHGIIEKANSKAMAIQAEAEAILQGALSTSAKITEEKREVLDSVRAERLGLIADAQAEAEKIESEAMQQAEYARAELAGHAQHIRHNAEVDAERIIAEATERADAIVAVAEQQLASARTFADEAPVERGLDSQPVATVVPTRDTPAERDVWDDTPEHVTIDLTDKPAATEEIEAIEEITAESAPRAARPSRYRSRSANPLSLGDDAGSVIGSMDSLRTKE